MKQIWKVKLIFSKLTMNSIEFANNTSLISVRLRIKKALDLKHNDKLL